jgi:amidase
MVRSVEVRRRTPAVVPTEDAVVVERLLGAGAVITGKTNLDDLAFGGGSAFGGCRNPRNPNYSTGGSSSGSGAAVAAGMVDLALGGDEGGSIRIPSAWCGLVGMNATHGLVPSYGMAYMDHTIDHIGPMTQTVTDNARMLEVIAGSDWRDPQWVRATPSPGQYLGAAKAGVSGLRIGVVPEALEPSGCTPDVLAAFEKSLSVLSRLGANIVEDPSIPLWTEAPHIGFAVLALGLYGMAVTHGVGFGHLGRVDPVVTAAWAAQTRLQGDDLPPLIKSTLVLTEYMLDHYQAVPFARAQNLRLELKRQVMAALAGVDVLVTPDDGPGRNRVDGPPRGKTKRDGRPHAEGHGLKQHDAARPEWPSCSHRAVWHRRTRPAGRTADHRLSLRGGTLLSGGIRAGVGPRIDPKQDRARFLRWE